MFVTVPANTCLTVIKYLWCVWNLPLKAAKGSSTKNRYVSVLRDENDDKWAEGLMSNGLVFHGCLHYFPKGGTRTQVQRHICLLAFEIP